MSTSGNEDQNQRNPPVMEDSPSQRIEFLRARLLSERSVSRTARLRANELAKRVAELEEQLKTVTLQRKKAEKATATVLAILENHGVGDASDGFDSGSDHDPTLCESNVSDSKDERKEASTERNMETRENGGETYSSSEIDSSPSTGRSLSWKSDRESRHSSVRKKYTDSGRRSSSFASSGSSSKHVGKSCRRIRHRETRSAAVEESDNDNIMHAARGDSGTSHTEDLPGLAEFGTESLRDDHKHHAENGQSEFPAFQELENQNQVDDSNLNSTHESSEDMEKALQRQAKLISQNEAEERAQREWEEKYRENTSFISDTGDLGNNSDVTEERDETKASEQPSSGKALFSEGHEHKPERVDRHLNGGSKEASNGFQPPPPGKLKSEKPVVSESSSPEFAFPVSNGIRDRVRSENNAWSPPYSLHQSSHSSSVSAKPSEHASSSSNGGDLQKGQTSGRTYELALISNEPNKNLRNVLDALEQAKLSLRHKLNSSAAELSNIHGGEIGGGVEIPVGCPTLFRLPTDLQWNSPAKPGVSSFPPQLTNRSSETLSDKFFPNHFLEPRSTSSAENPFSSSSSTRTPGSRLILDPALDTSLPPSTRLNFFNPQQSTRGSFSSNHTFPTYPFSPAAIPQFSSPGGFSTTHSAIENKMPPSTSHFSLYDDHIQPPHMYR